MYSSFAQKLFSCDNSNSACTEIQSLIKKLRERVPAYDEFKIGFSSLVFTNTNSKQKNLIRYILRRFSVYHQHKTLRDYDDQTIEHIHPQSATDSQWTEEIVGSVGNLILLDEEANVRLGSKNFAEKIKYLKENGYSLSGVLATSNDWSPDGVRQQTEDMSDIAYRKIWKI